MLTKKSFVLILANVVLALLIGGCMGKSQPTRFYTLTSTVEAQKLVKESSASSNLAIGIGPVKLADHLNQSRIVTRMYENKTIKRNWINGPVPLRNNIINVLAENIISLLNTEKIFVHPWRSFISIDYQIIAEIIRFDGEPGNQATLEARWNGSKLSTNRLSTIKRSSIHGNNGY